MVSWPSNWQSQALSAAGIDVTAKSLKVMSAWRKSTLLDPWTNNPIGMPAMQGKTLPVPGTRYAMFRSISDFYRAFAAFAKTTDGRKVVNAITSDVGYGPVWREIASLRWPGSVTETDYPAAILDLTEQSYRDSVSSSPVAERKTSGSPKAPIAVHQAMREQAKSITEATRAFTDARVAVRHLLRRHARNG